MAEQQLQIARQLINEKRYTEARALLSGLDHPTAKKWLAKLDEIAPEAKPVTTAPAPQRSGSGVTTVLLTLILLVTLGIASYGAFFRPVTPPPDPRVDALLTNQTELSSQVQSVGQRLDEQGNLGAQLQGVEDQVIAAQTQTANVGASVNDVMTEIDDLQASMQSAQVPQPQGWEYALLQYSQIPSYQENENPFELALIDRPEYVDAFDNGCSASNIACIQRNFKGMSYYIEILGRDGWEMISINNTSSNSYSVEIFFKRPVVTFTPDT